MIDMLIEFIVVYVLTWIGILMFIKVAPSLSLIDIPNKRSSHVKPVPRGAGIIFGSTFLITILLFQYEFVVQHYLTLIATLLVFLVGVYDDIKDTSPKVKILVLMLASTLVFFDGYEITHLGYYFGWTLSLGVFSYLFTVFAVTGFTNALNLIDGLDGLAASVSILILFVLSFFGFIHDDLPLLYTSVTLISALLAFLTFNWNPARVFMGDSGSLLLGFIIAVLSIHALQYIHVTAILFLAGLPILDTLVVFSRRIQRHVSPFNPDKNHLHHILYRMKYDVRYTVYILILIQMAFSVIALSVYQGPDSYNLILFGIFFMLFFGIFDPRFKRRRKEGKRASKKARLILQKKAKEHEEAMIKNSEHKDS